jgi:excisionase family DNA binding protein
MSRLHTRFRSIHKSTRLAAKDLFDSKPWSGSEEDKQTKFERFLRDASAVYSIPQPTLSVIADGDILGLVAPNTIVLDKYSVTSLFNAFRQHMQYCGVISVPFLDRRDAQAWACSLFYTVRPILFRKRVREGRIVGVHPDDLLTAASLAARQDEVDEAFAGIVSASYEDDEDVEPDEETTDDEVLPTSVPAGADIRTELVDCSVAAAAAHMGVSPSTIRNMIRDGRVAAYQDGRRWIVRVESRYIA